jgi:hypothetical protein
MLQLFSAFLSASNFTVPRVDFDLHPGTLAFMILCGALIAGVLTGIVALARESEDSSDERMPVAGTASGAHADPAEEPEPFIPDEAQPKVSPSVSALFDDDAPDEAPDALDDVDAFIPSQSDRT